LLLFEIENMKTLLSRSSVRMRTPDLLRVWLPRCYPWTILLPRLKWTDRMAVRRSADEYMDDKSRCRCGGISSSPRRKWLIGRLNWLVSGVWSAVWVAQVWWLIH